MKLNADFWKKEGPVRIFDANGLEWKDVVSCDTETGYVQTLVRDDKGELKRNAAGGCVYRQVRTAAPLRWEKIK